MAVKRTGETGAVQPKGSFFFQILQTIGRPFFWLLLAGGYLLLFSLDLIKLLPRLLRKTFQAAAKIVSSRSITPGRAFGIAGKRIVNAAGIILNSGRRALRPFLDVLRPFRSLKNILLSLKRTLPTCPPKLPEKKVFSLVRKWFSRQVFRIFPAGFSRLPGAIASTLRKPLFFPKPSLKKLLFLVFICFLALTGILAYSFMRDLPQPEKLMTREQALTTKIFDRRGTLLYKIYRRQNRTLVKLEEIPLELVQATIAVEDAEFYRHPGLSWRGIARAFFQNLESEKLYGGSTITQQLVKNALLTPERTWQRKIREAVLAVWVEQKFSKDEILQMYLNEVGYGGAVYGAEEAAQKYFGKSVRDIDLAEAAFLAGLPASPNHFSPFGVSPQIAKERQAVVLKRMRQENFISEEAAEKALREDLYLATQKVEILAPHFVMYVKELLENKYGKRLVEEGGLQVTTSLDLELQAKVQQIVSDEVFRLTNLHVGNGAALVTRPATGEILTMVGSKDYFDLAADGNVNVTLRPRQPGSSIKPLMYSLALTKGFTAATVIPDTPITYQIPGQPPYSPQNYDNRSHGNVPLRVALASSYNVPAVKVLSALGVNAFVEHAQKLGITTWDDPSRFGLSLTLGGGEVKMTDMAVAYGSLANLGQKADLNPVLEVRDHRGKILKTNSAQDQLFPADNPFIALLNSVSKIMRGGARKPNQASLALAADAEAPNPDNDSAHVVVDPRIAYILTDILADNAARTPAFGPHSVLVVPDHPHVAVKTGTTQNLRDNWTIGYSPDYLAAVWVGNNDNTPMNRVASGVTGASPIWQKIMIEVLKNTPDREFPLPEGLVSLEICSTTGTLPCEGCGGKWEYFLPGTEPKIHCAPEVTEENSQERQNQPYPVTP